MLTIVRGNDFSKIGAVLADGKPTNCTGWGIRGYLRSADGTFNVELTAAWTDAATGVFMLDNPAPTTDYPAGRLSLTAELTSPAGQPYKTAPEPVQVTKE